MTIEVKQLIIKSTVGDDSDSESPVNAQSAVDTEALKAEILGECQRRFLEMLREVQER